MREQTVIYVHYPITSVGLQPICVVGNAVFYTKVTTKHGESSKLAFLKGASSALFSLTFLCRTSPLALRSANHTPTISTSWNPTYRSINWSGVCSQTWTRFWFGRTGNVSPSRLVSAMSRCSRLIWLGSPMFTLKSRFPTGKAVSPQFLSTKSLVCLA